MKKIEGRYAKAKIFTDNVEDYALAQVQLICDQKGAEGSVIRLMPDVHPGKVGPIGLTMTVNDTVLPNIVGIDIGCGITIAKLKQRKLEYQKLDTVIQERIPSGFRIRSKPHRFTESFPFEELKCYRHISLDRIMRSMGSLGGGNHFIEVSIAAGEIVGLLYDAFAKQYADPESAHSMRSLNVLCVRLVFLLFGEDANLFGHHGMFHDYMAETDTRHMRRALIDLFKILDTPVDIQVCP